MRAAPARHLAADVDHHRMSVEAGEPGTVIVDGTPIRITWLDERTARVAGPRGSTLAAWAEDGAVHWVFIDGRAMVVRLSASQSYKGSRTSAVHHDAVTAPMPATVRRIDVEVGRRVAKGQVLILLEAMKMELPLTAPHEGVVEEVACRVGDLVLPGAPLVTLATGLESEP